MIGPRDYAAEDREYLAIIERVTAETLAQFEVADLARITAPAPQKETDE